MPAALKAVKTERSMSALERQYRNLARDPVLAQFEMLKRETKTTDAHIMRTSGISRSCLRNWRRDGKTRRPQHITLVFAFRAMGYDFRVAKI